MATYQPAYNDQYYGPKSSSASSAARQQAYAKSRQNPYGGQPWPNGVPPNQPHSRSHGSQPSSSASAAASASSSSSSASIAYPSMPMPPPYAGAPPLPPGANIPQAQWQAGFWAPNPAYKGHPGGGVGPGGQQQGHVPWIPSQQWMVHRQHPPPGQQHQQQQQSTYNPYKRHPRPPSAEYLAMKLVDNPLGLQNMTPVSMYVPFSDALLFFFLSSFSCRLLPLLCLFVSGSLFSFIFISDPSLGVSDSHPSLLFFIRAPTKHAHNARMTLFRSLSIAIISVIFFWLDGHLHPCRVFKFGVHCRIRRP
ncbi:hypothetical protein BDN70DRAFT_883334 [Pholiota conissans]|uniref:Uncharacterized protein n=1 Tax=Pholiota conissans TaxID=109636 RepID=A0A9P6CR29_9AGAR|nr:hypothetical protein BDN70DRAFT_883334 [Pholiota conissans]